MSLIPALRAPSAQRKAHPWTTARKALPRGGILPEALALVGEALLRLRYSAIQPTVHDGKVMQIDVTEGKRLTD
ncbi:MAG: YezD family protein [Erythrobacter sp.]|uniref:YezD family protein n=1 Tax=Erythrobacter sp. TaxID=1042 RepID=UPI0025D8DEB8|nr:YezD family protein [Erythrobacter sp.]MCM0000574.1 YezD family protein [Erythrobacter sp.]